MATVQKCRAADFYIVQWGEKPDLEAAVVEMFWSSKRNKLVYWCYFCDSGDDCTHIGLTADYRKAAHEPLTGEQRED